MNTDKQKLYEDQKKLLDTFLMTGAIDKAQYEKSLNGLKEKMGVIEESDRYVVEDDLCMNKFSIMTWNIKGGASILWDKDIKSKMNRIKDIIMDRDRDIVILTEFVLYRGIDDLFYELDKKYYYFITTSTCYNGILIALKKGKFNINSEEIFNKEKFVISNSIGNIDSPDFLEVYIKDYNLYIIGTRIRVKIKKQNDKECIKYYKENQINALKNYIDDKIYKDSNCKFVICGDWNMNSDYLKKYLNNDSKFIIDGNNTNSSIYSFVFPNNTKILLDHFITLNIDNIFDFKCDGWQFNTNNIKCSDHDIIYQNIAI